MTTLCLCSRKIYLNLLPNLFIFLADITKLKPSNDGKSVRVFACPTSRALLVDNNQVTSASTKDADAFVEALKLEMVLDRDSSSPHWMCNDVDEQSEDLCPELYRDLMVVLAYGNKTKIAKVTGLKAAKHDDHRALELKFISDSDSN